MDWPRNRNKVAPCPPSHYSDNQLHTSRSYDEGASSDTKVVLMKPLRAPTRQSSLKRPQKIIKSRSLDARLRPTLRRTNATEEPALDVRPSLSPATRRDDRVSPTIVIDMPDYESNKVSRYYGRVVPGEEFINLRSLDTDAGTGKSGNDAREKKRRRYGWKRRHRKVN